MAENHQTKPEQIYIFNVHGTYIFKYYFENSGIFNRFKEYYNNDAYRFEIPPDELGGQVSYLSRHDYEPIVVDDIKNFVVVVKKYQSHPDNIFSDSIIQRSKEDYNFFLMKNDIAIEQAIADGATKVTETDLNHPFE